MPLLRYRRRRLSSRNVIRRRPMAYRGVRPAPTRSTRSRLVIRRNLRPATLAVTRRVYCGTLNPNITTVNGFYQYVATSLDRTFKQFDATNTTMKSLPNLAEYKALFEQYKINGLKYEFFPRQMDLNQPQNATGTSRNIPQVLILMDKTMSPNNIPTGTWGPDFLNSLLENGSGKTYRADKKFTVYIKPSILENVSSGASRTVGPTWLDLTTTDGTLTNHRGFHMFIYNNTFDNASLPTANLDVTVTYYLQFRNQK